MREMGTETPGARGGRGGSRWKVERREMAKIGPSWHGCVDFELEKICPNSFIGVSFAHIPALSGPRSGLVHS